MFSTYSVYASLARQLFDSSAGVGQHKQYLNVPVHSCSSRHVVSDMCHFLLSTKRTKSGLSIQAIQHVYLNGI